MKMLMTKKEVRKQARKTIKKMTKKDKEKRALEVIGLLKENDVFSRAKKVAIYYPLKHEINLLGLLEMYPDKKFYFPKTNKGFMDFRKVNDLTTLVDGKFDLKEPNENAIVETLIDVYLVPCMATYKNYRIGHGAGYYDKYFKRLDGYKIGIVFKELKDLKIDVEKHDIPMDIIL